MNFLKTFFNNKPKRASQKESEIQKRKEKLLLNTSNPTPLISEPNRKKSQPLILKKQRPKTPEFDFQRAAQTLPSKIFEFGSTKVIKENKEIDWGTLIGVINKREANEEILPQECFQVGIGKGSEISSIDYLRKKSLNSIAVFWQRETDEIFLNELIGCKERQIWVVSSWQKVVKIFVRLQQNLLENFKSKLLVQFSDKLVCNLYSLKQNFIVEFDGPEAFTSLFRRKINILNNQEQTERLIQSMTIEDYFRIKNEVSSWYFLEKRIQGIRNQLQNEKKLKKIEQQISREMIEEQKRKEEQIQNNSMKFQIQNDYETQYFKRQSQKQTRQSGSRQPESSDFYYIISQYTHSQQDSQQEEEEEQKQQQTTQISVPEPQRQLFRCKSANFNHHFEKAELDDQFFTKY